MAATAIFDLSRRVHEEGEMQLKAQRITEENEIHRRQSIIPDPQDSEFGHLMQPSQYQPPPSTKPARQAEVQLKVNNWPNNT